MKKTKLKSIESNRIFNNKYALFKLLKRKGYFVSPFFENHFSGILLIDKKSAIKIKYANFTNGIKVREVIPIKYNEQSKEFTHV